MTTPAKRAAFRRELAELEAGPHAIGCPSCHVPAGISCLTRDGRVHGARTDRWLQRKYDLKQLLAWEGGR